MGESLFISGFEAPGSRLVGAGAGAEESTITREGESGIADLQARKFRSCKCPRRNCSDRMPTRPTTQIPAPFDWTVASSTVVMMLGARGYRHMVRQSGAGTMVTEHRTTCSGEGLAQAGRKRARRREGAITDQERSPPTFWPTKQTRSGALRTPRCTERASWCGIDERPLSHDTTGRRDSGWPRMARTHI